MADDAARRYPRHQHRCGSLEKRGYLEREDHIQITTDYVL
jgi:hypothetical protein